MSDAVSIPDFAAQLAELVRNTELTTEELAAELATLWGTTENIVLLFQQMQAVIAIRSDILSAFQAALGLKGTVASVSALPAVAAERDAYKIENVLDAKDGHLYVRVAGAWTDLGRLTGSVGRSAYEVAVANGYEGTEEEYAQDPINKAVLAATAADDANLVRIATDEVREETLAAKAAAEEAADLATTRAEAARVVIDAGLTFVFSSTTADANPGVGKARFSFAAATLGLAGTIYVNKAFAGGGDASTWIANLTTSTNPTSKGELTLRQIDDPTKFVTAYVQDVTDASTYAKISIQVAATNNPAGVFADGVKLAATFAKAGNTGAAGAAGSSAADAERINDRKRAYLPRELHITTGNNSAARATRAWSSGVDVWTMPIGGDAWWEIEPNLQNGFTFTVGDVVSLAVERVSGTPSAITVEQYNGSTLVGSAVNMTLKGDFWTLEGQTIAATVTKLRLRIKNLGMPDPLVFKPPRFVRAPYFLQEPVASEGLLRQIVDFQDGQTASNLWASPTFEIAAGAPTQTGGVFTLAAGDYMRLRLPNPSLPVGTVVTALLKATRASAYRRLSLGESANTTPPGSTKSFSRIGNTDWYVATMTVGEVVPAGPAYFFILADNRDPSDLSATAAALTIRADEITLAVGSTPVMPRPPSAVSAALSGLLTSAAAMVDGEKSRAQGDRFGDRRRAYFPVRAGTAAGNSGGASLTRAWSSGSDQLTMTTGGDAYWEFAPVHINGAMKTRFAVGDLVALAVEAVSGAPTSITVEQFNGSTLVGSATTMVLKGDYYVVEEQTVAATVTKIRVRIKNTSATPFVFRAPQFVRSRYFLPFPHSTEIFERQGVGFAEGQAASSIWANPMLVNLIGTPTYAGGVYTFPAGSQGYIRCPMVGLTAGDQLTALIKVGRTGALRQLDFGEAVSTSNPPSPTSFARIGNTDWYRASFIVGEQVSGPTYFSIFVDNRNPADGSEVAADLTIASTDISVVKGDTPVVPRVPGPVKAAIAAASAITVLVDTTGSDALTGDTKATAVASITRALALGATRIGLRAGQDHRTTGISFSELNSAALFSYKVAGDTADKARVLGSVNIPAASFTADGTYPALYGAPVTTPVNPGCVWEIAGGVPARMGVLSSTTGYRPYPTMAASKAAAAGVAGGCWYDAAGGKIYVRPYGDDMTGKSYEVPVCASVMTVTGVAEFTWGGVDIQYGASHCANVSRTSMAFKNIAYGRSGADDGVHLADSAFIGAGLYAIDCGDDAIGTDSNVVLRATQCYFQDGAGDHVAPHGSNHDIEIDGVTSVNAGKISFVTIGVNAKIRLRNWVERGAYTFAIQVRPNNGAYGAGSTLVELDNCSFETALDFAKDTAALSLRARNVSTPKLFWGGDDADVQRARLRGSADSGLRVDAGVLTATDVEIRRAGVYGIDLRGGELIMKGGSVLRSATGIRQVAGTLTLDANDPVNVYGNTAQFSGVSGGDQAKTVSVAAV
jgi:hypothetical protein